MTAGRLYCIQSWNNASETSGEQIGNRLAQSRGLHFDRNGNANLALYAEENTKPKKATKPICEQISLADRHYNRIEAMSIQFEKEYNQGKISEEEYSYLKPKMEKRLKAAWARLSKENGWEEDEVAVEANQTSNESPSFYEKITPESLNSDVGYTEVAPSNSEAKIPEKCLKEELTRFVVGGIVLLSGLGIISQLFF